jgi:hypothetical protein
MYNKVKTKVAILLIKQICTKMNSYFVLKNDKNYLEFEKFMEVLDRYLKIIKIVVYVLLAVLNISIIIALVMFVNEVLVAFFVGVVFQIALSFSIEEQKKLLFSIQQSVMVIYEIDSVNYIENGEN